MNGLSSAEAKARLAAAGPNRLPEKERRTSLRIVADVVREPMFLLLVASATLYVIFGDLREAMTLLSFVIVMITITVVQEGRTERALDALRDLTSPRARVLRDGVESVVPATEIVVGDLVLLGEGDRIPADALLREGSTLSIDESLLTGESAPVARHPDPKAERIDAPGRDTVASLFFGTLVVAGRGVAEVVATGARSELGKIGASLEQVEPTSTPLQREVASVVKRLAYVGGGISLALVLVRGFLGGDWLPAMLSGITLAMALLPEEFPVVLTVFFALGAWRIAKSRVLTRRMSAVETLGGVHVLCTDKTGTLTVNRMTVQRLRTRDRELELVPEITSLPEDMHELVELSILASPNDPVDPMEKAFVDLGRRTLGGTEHLHPNWSPRREYPLSPELLAVTWAWEEKGESDGAPPSATTVATKGAPEAVFDLCHLPPEELVIWRDRASAMAKEGLRVLGVARGKGDIATLPAIAHDLSFEMVGLVGLLDPLRDDVVAAVAACRSAGVRVLMITGDHPETGRAIAAAAGIGDSGVRVVNGADLDAYDDARLALELETASVVARAVPAQKLRIVRSLQSKGHVVGMTGDGVNDAPALKAADIGIAMGKRGTDVAREAAALVLVEDDFGSIVEAVRIGRRIYDNLQKAFSYIVAVHVPIAGICLVPALLGWDVLLTPALVVFLEFIIDPACSIVFEMESEEKNVMSRPPRARDARLFTSGAMFGAFVQGALVLVPALVMIAWMRSRGFDVGAQRAVAFAMLVAGNVAVLFADRGLDEPFWRTLRRVNPAAPYLVAGVAILLATLLGIRPIGEFFSFDTPSAGVLFVAFLAAVAPVLAFDARKALRRGGWAGVPIEGESNARSVR